MRREKKNLNFFFLAPLRPHRLPREPVWPSNNNNNNAHHIYHALINALGVHMIHINLNTIFCTHVEHSPTKQFTLSIIRKNK